MSLGFGLGITGIVVYRLLGLAWTHSPRPSPAIHQLSAHLRPLMVASFFVIAVNALLWAAETSPQLERFLRPCSATIASLSTQSSRYREAWAAETRTHDAVNPCQEVTGRVFSSASVPAHRVDPRIREKNYRESHEKRDEWALY
jgi:hypothetical protein